jgi:hypothetical protein
MDRYYYYPPYEGGIMLVVERRRYGFLRFCFDATLTVLTGGLWLIWIFVREMRKR